MNETNNLRKALDTLAASSFDFNTIAGKASSYSENAIFSQIRLINEEVLELNESFRNNDVVEVLDAVIDIYVVLNGLTQLLDKAGINIEKAAELVAANNLSKFPLSVTVADNTVKKLAEDNISATVSYNQQYGVFVVKDSNGKVRKPVGFEPVDLQGCVPDSLITSGFIQEQ